MPLTNSRFDWPDVFESKAAALIGSKLSEPFLEERRARYATSWNNRRNWRFGHYFGREDARLWVPKRLPTGMAHDTLRVINFSHKLGRKALRVLALAYCAGTLAVGFAIALLLGVRW